MLLLKRYAVICAFIAAVWPARCGAAALPAPAGVPVDSFRLPVVTDKERGAVLIGIAAVVDQVVTIPALRLFQNGLRKMLEETARRANQMFVQLDEDRKKRIQQLGAQELPLDEQVRLLKARLRSNANEERSP